MVRRDEEEEARIRRQNLNGTGTTEYGRNETWRAKYNGLSGKGKGNERDRRVGARKWCERWKGGGKKGVMNEHDVGESDRKRM